MPSALNTFEQRTPISRRLPSDGPGQRPAPGKQLAKSPGIIVTQPARPVLVFCNSRVSLRLAVDVAGPTRPGYGDRQESKVRGRPSPVPCSARSNWRARPVAIGGLELRTGRLLGASRVAARWLWTSMRWGFWCPAWPGAGAAALGQGLGATAAAFCDRRQPPSSPRFWVRVHPSVHHPLPSALAECPVGCRTISGAVCRQP